MAKNALITFWESIEKTADSMKIARAAKSLQRKAEIDVASASDAYEQEQAAILEQTRLDVPNRMTPIGTRAESYAQAAYQT